MTDSQSADVFIAGGGPAGLAAAIAAVQRGFSVMVADAARPPIDKACGEGIMPEGVEALGAFGVQLSATDVARLEGIRFLDESGEVCASFPQGTGLGVRRTALHSALIARAERVGVRLLWRTRVEALRQGEAILRTSEGAAASSTVRCQFAICADGLNSSLRQMAGLGAAKVRRRRFGFRSHFRVPPWSRFVEVYWADYGQIYVTPISAEEICVALLTSDPHARLETVLPAFPGLREKLLHSGADGVPGKPVFGLRGQAHGEEKRMGGITSTSRLQAVVHGRIALVGDASGSADAITGDGLSLAFQQAIALAEAMASGRLGSYQKAHVRISRLPRAMGELMLLLDGHPRLRRRVFAAFAQSPELFARMLALHTRSISPLEFGAADCLRFGWKLLSA